MRGGKREGAGRKSSWLDDEAMELSVVKLPVVIIDSIKEAKLNGVLANDIVLALKLLVNDKITISEKGGDCYIRGQKRCQCRTSKGFRCMKDANLITAYKHHNGLIYNFLSCKLHHNFNFLPYDNPILLLNK